MARLEMNTSPCDLAKQGGGSGPLDYEPGELHVSVALSRVDERCFTMCK